MPQETQKTIFRRSDPQFSSFEKELMAMARNEAGK